MLKHLWHEIEPIVTHVLAILVIILGLVVIGLVLNFLEIQMPQFQAKWQKIKEVDAKFIEIMLYIFGITTTIRILIRSVRSIWQQDIKKSTSEND